MRHFLTRLTLVFLPLSAPVLAQEPVSSLTIKPDAPQTYVVEKGDTLWDISEMYLDSPWLWPRLWQVNPEIDNPHLIYPGDKLSLVWLNGQPVLSLKPVIKLSPKIRVRDKKAVPTVDEGLVLPYLQSDRLVTQSDIDSAQRVLGTSDGRKFLTAQDRLFISGKQQHQKWGIYRAVAEYQRSEPQSSMVSLRLVASAHLSSVEASFSSLQVDSQLQEILVNDVVLPELNIDQAALTTTFYPAPTTAGQFAHIVGSMEGGKFSAKNHVVVIDRGTHDNLRQGSMFSLSEAGAVVYGQQGDYSYDSEALGDKIQLPSTEVGNLMVIRPYQYFSLALVTQSSKPISQDILAVSPLSSDDSDK
ncbi:LysM peptidoglycan-binding domain-containing protein [Vibrio sp. D404a]|uniref:LysM peptidoglycan-binding domain-containing protein n=1 Tax=unclassified Vibrio TaxID=2614977 RepID=UPI002554C37B|nr:MULTISPECIES: LysM peptidoglycan-binding domain-containing protein [unclassified Vibrio]MDK9739179.1 LysM peptidoglycan-binding domain-containing protein [Vibrio sp. D404a]MDK9799656.1 LysM peptidoglycan-binding domain-containing protein [Vibrio sp. D449a]